MKSRTLLLGVLVGLVAFMVGGALSVSAYVANGTFDASISPNWASKSKKDLTPIKNLKLKGTIGNGPDGSPPITKDLTIKFQDKAIIDARALKGTAKFSDVVDRGNCSLKYRIGSGTALASIPSAEPSTSITLKATVNICVVEKTPGSLFTVAVASYVASFGQVVALKAEVKVVRGKPLIILDAEMPTVQGITPRIKSLDIKINRVKRQRVKGKMRYLLNAPVKCPKKGKKKGLWSIVQIIRFKGDIPPLAMTSEHKCRQAKKS